MGSYSWEWSAVRRGGRRGGSNPKGEVLSNARYITCIECFPLCWRLWANGVFDGLGVCVLRRGRRVISWQMAT